MSIQHYEIESEIGRGDTAVVYRAADAQGRPVALKVALNQDPFRLEQMQRESGVLAWLKGEGIPKCYDYFVWDDQHCLALELVDGRDFDAVWQANPAPVTEAQAVAWGLHIAGIIEQMHTHTTPHLYRFIAPDHIMLTPAGQLYLIDYGKVMPYVPDAKLPALGLAGYSAPEQYVGRADFRSDVFGLGVWLYHLTTGRDPRAPHAAFLFHVLPPRALNPALSPAFENVILQAVEHKAADRFPTITAMREALAAC